MACSVAFHIDLSIVFTIEWNGLSWLLAEDICLVNPFSYFHHRGTCTFRLPECIFISIASSFAASSPSHHVGSIIRATRVVISRLKRPSTSIYPTI